MKRFLLNLVWYLGIVVLADMLSFLVFFMLHGTNLGGAGPFVIAAALFFVIMTVQAFTHLYVLERRYPERETGNIWTVIVVSSLGFLTMPLMIIVLMALALKTPMQ